MRVALDTRALGVPQLRDRGIGRYTACLREALLAVAGDDLVELGELRRPPAPGRVGDLYEHLLLSRDVTRAQGDVVHSPSIDFVSLRPGAPLVVTVHDLVPLKQPKRYLRTGLKHRLRYAAVRRAARVIVPAQCVGRDLGALLGVEPERVKVVPEAPAPVFRPVSEPRAQLERLGLPDRFLLWVGGLDPVDPRKGVEALAAAVRDGNGPALVLAGRTGRKAERLAAPGRVTLAGRLSDAELAALYSAADALVFPSEDEGFGLPPIEALACGTPVAAYASGALPETLAGAQGAELVASGDLPELLAAAQRLAGTAASPPRRSWEDVARETWIVYEQAAQRA
jgi:glycosyltransferase involved in cell wall biosynthesis